MSWGERSCKNKPCPIPDKCNPWTCNVDCEKYKWDGKTQPDTKSKNVSNVKKANNKKQPKTAPKNPVPQSIKTKGTNRAQQQSGKGIIVDKHGNIIKSNGKLDIDELVATYAAKHGFDGAFPYIDTFKELHKFVQLKLQYIPKDKIHKVEQILGTINNYFAVAMATREATIKNQLDIYQTQKKDLKILKEFVDELNGEKDVLRPYARKYCQGCGLLKYQKETSLWFRLRHFF
jgi:hypothetical protein